MCDPDYVEEPEQRKCYHCGAAEADGDPRGLMEAHCADGFGLLHCSECFGVCDNCLEIYCQKELKEYECDELYGLANLCEGCAVDLGLEEMEE